MTLFRGLTGKVMLLVLATGLVSGLLLAHSYLFSRGIILSSAEDQTRDRAEDLASQVEGELSAIADIAHTCAPFVERSGSDKAALLNLLRTLVERNKHIFGSGACFEPYAFETDSRAFCPYFHKRDESVEYVQLGNDNYNYFDKEFYREPKKLKRPYWSEPYYDEGGGDVMMTTYSYPLFAKSRDGSPGKFSGVLTADVSVQWLTRHLASFSVFNTGYCFLVSGRGTFLVHPKGSIDDTSIFTLAQRMGKPRIEDVGRRMLDEASGFADIGTLLSDRESFLAFARIPSTGWSLGIVVPRDEILAPLTGLYKKQVGIATLIVIGLLALTLVLAASITGPLRRMVAVTARVAHGDLDVDLTDIRSHDEVGNLARAFQSMTISLKKYIRDLMEMTGAKQRMESELEISAQIQRSMLPSRFPAFPERNDFDIYAVMEPAKMVGGDFYQFFLIDEDHLCLAVGDVADKGVPASLFMAVTTFLIRVAAGQGASPDQILSLVNRQLCLENDTCTFVTIFCAILDLRTGELRYSNAGHDAPLVLGPAKDVMPLPIPPGPAAGLVDSPTYRTETTVLESNAILFAYTDGLTDALNEKQEPYSDERLVHLLNSLDSRDVESVVKSVKEDVARFCGGTEQFDDLTVLAVRFGGTERIQ
ncbi:MAG: SpoIIE family protein phosphatase [Desulfomonilaceae bacterium]|nr:SpoIIE family protein phosphatase [Desulfomonilaceae bacterium]